MHTWKKKNKRKELENIIINLEDELADLAKTSDPDGYTHYIPMKLAIFLKSNLIAQMKLFDFFILLHFLQARTQFDLI